MILDHGGDIKNLWGWKYYNYTLRRSKYRKRTGNNKMRYSLGDACGHSWGEIMYNAEDRHTRMLTETLRNSHWTAKHGDELASRDHPGCPPPSEKGGWLYRKPRVFPLGSANFLFKRHPVMGRKWHNQETGIEQAECWRSELILWPVFMADMNQMWAAVSAVRRPKAEKGEGSDTSTLIAWWWWWLRSLPVRQTLSRISDLAGKIMNSTLAGLQQLRGYL